MMFRTEIAIPECPEKISHNSKIMTIGSCFSDCMGTRFSANKFNVLANPFGTTYNPISIAKLLKLSLTNKLPEETSYCQTQGLWANYHFHSSFSTKEKKSVTQSIKQAVEKAHEALIDADWLIITFGTAFVYEHRQLQEIVNNCHKVPAAEFDKRLLSQQEIEEALTNIIEQLRKANPSLKIILTVSPVRHIKDTIERNSVSKSILRLVCDRLASEMSGTYYFPSYEIMMDDLRDYRFYTSDLIHPSEMAEDYIWDKFSNAYFSTDTQKLVTGWGKIAQALQHRPFNPDTDQHQQFLRKTLQKLEALKVTLSVEREIEQLKSQLL